MSHNYHHRYYYYWLRMCLMTCVVIDRWLWTEAGAQMELESAMGIGGFGYPAMAAINSRKMKFALLRGSFSETGIHEFLRYWQILTDTDRYCVVENTLRLCVLFFNCVMIVLSLCLQGALCWTWIHCHTGGRGHAEDLRCWALGRQRRAGQWSF